MVQARSRLLAGCVAGMVGVLSVAAPAARAVLIYSAGSAIQQSTAPADDRGWQYVGSFNGAAGVAVSSDLFVTAQHLGASVGSTFVFAGQPYTVTYAENIPNTEASLVRVSSQMPTSGAPLYSGSVTSQTATIIGYGGPAGSAYIGADGQQHGWYWTSPSASKSWGTTTTYSELGTDPDTGKNYIVFPFPAVNGASIYTAGDSGGGMFVFSNGAWRLAGVASGVDGYYTDSAGKNPVSVAIYSGDGSGLYEETATDVYTPATGPQFGYASDLADESAYLMARIAALDAVPEPATLSALGVGMVVLLGRRGRSA